MIMRDDKLITHITVPHFIQVDQVVVSRIGDLLTLRCVPNDSVATVTWLKG